MLMSDSFSCGRREWTPSGGADAGYCVCKLARKSHRPNLLRGLASRGMASAFYACECTALGNDDADDAIDDNSHAELLADAVAITSHLVDYIEHLALLRQSSSRAALLPSYMVRDFQQSPAQLMRASI